MYHYRSQKNIVHRDLKLGNMVLNKKRREVVITNFCLGKHLVCEDDLLKDQRGSPAYISPDVLSGAYFSLRISRCFNSEDMSLGGDISYFPWG